MYIQELKNWFSQNPGLVQFIQFVVPITISLLSIRFIKTKRREPVLILDVKDLKDFGSDKQQNIKNNGYLIANSDYILQIRNEGDEIALNTYIESDNFQITEYENHQIGTQEELLIKIIKKTHNSIKNLKELNGEIFKIYCETLGGAGFYFKYQIIDIREKRVRFVSKGYGRTEQNKGNFRLDK